MHSQKDLTHLDPSHRCEMNVLRGTEDDAEENRFLNDVTPKARSQTWTSCLACPVQLDALACGRSHSHPAEPSITIYCYIWYSQPGASLAQMARTITRGCAPRLPRSEWILPKKKRSYRLLWIWCSRTIRFQGGSKTRAKGARVEPFSRRRWGSERWERVSTTRTGRFWNTNRVRPSL